MTGSEDEANDVLERHLERSLPGADVIVLRRNNSDNRLESTGRDGRTRRSPTSSPRPSRAPAWRSATSVRMTRARARRRSFRASCAARAAPARRRACRRSSAARASARCSSAIPSRSRAARTCACDSVSQAVPALANLRSLARAERQAATDALTGMANARRVQDTLKRMVAQAMRTGDPLTAVMVDLDHFKALNDVHGHERGNEALAAVGQSLASGVRTSDFAGRYGGEEFILLLPNTDRAGGVVLAEKLGRDIAGIVLPELDRAITREPRRRDAAGRRARRGDARPRRGPGAVPGQGGRATAWSPRLTASA
jgi:diguanylate cyclase (GGDEF)-like protein